MGNKTNLIQRSLSGVVYVLIILLPILLNSVWGTAIVFSVFSAQATFEFQTIVSINRDRLMLKIFHALVGIFLFFLISSPTFTSNDHKGNVILALPYVAYVLFYLISELFRNRPNAIREVAYAIFSHFYCVLPLAVLLRLATDPTLILPKNVPDSMALTFWFLPLFVLIWLNDTGAYIIGSSFGKHKLIPRISPKKTWEGLFGGILFSLLGGLVFSYLFSGILTIFHWLIFAVLIAGFANFGDLFESLLKRSYKVKDSGNIIPGHGGVLDRIDSLLFSSIPAYIYIALISYLN